MSQEASRVSAIPEVREALIDFQKNFARRDGGAVLDGRDIGRTICPDAKLKIFMTASPEARARRRHAELVADGCTDSFESVLDELMIRDARDAGRATSPMKPSDDAIIIDTSDITAQEAIEIAFEHAARAVAA
jgi:cytidylate kinase